MILIVGPTGEVRCLYGEEINLKSIGALSIRRASYVEPTEHGDWSVNLEPVGGLLLGPYETRQEALEHEKLWLETNWLTADDCRPGSLTEFTT